MDFHKPGLLATKHANWTIETRLFINGEYSAAADNSVFTTVDPAAQQTLLPRSRAAKADVDRGGPGRPRRFRSRRLVQASPAQRKAVLTKLPT